jgi:APA family basic amino acid/polyamine antiporter
MPEAPSPTASRPQLVRAIGRWSLVALTVNCVIGSGVFGLPSELARLIGGASVLAVVFAAAAVAVVMACFAEVSSQFTETGGPYLYVRAAFGRLMGIEVGWLTWVVRIASCAANANLFVIYLAEFWPRATQPVSKFVILTLLVGTLAAVNCRGVRMGAQVSNAFTVAKLLPLVLVCGVGGFYLLTTNWHIFFVIGSTSTKDWSRAIVLLIFAYGGFEAALISGGEAKDPRKDTVFGLFSTLVICAVIYSLIQWVVVGVLPDPAHSSRPLADVARIILGRSGAVIVALGALVSVYGYLSANILATPRITFALAERDDFPSWFAAVHPTFRTPYFSILLFVVAVWLLATFGSFAGNATLSAGARLFSYALVCASVPVLRKKQPAAATFRLPAGPLFAVLGVLICVALLFGIDFNKSLLLVATIVIGLVNWLVVRNRNTTATSRRAVR